MAPMTPRQKTIAWDRQACLLLLQVRSCRVTKTCWRSVAESVVAVCFVVDFGVALDVVVGGGDAYAVRDVQAVEIDAVGSSDLRK